ncbi:hypothetical protein IE53DRAFT_170994 [Violaceomyces palustris]|uniref:Uncharacterized protein n=1 Tax=Violaceomyces palustris TaxID=1673888 RepID=A0ACD0P5Z7_9BASI|nr:hypothetical protein IE53DRAFT_170994 [Violaceomyces palustris]
MHSGRQQQGRKTNSLSSTALKLPSPPCFPLPANNNNNSVARLTLHNLSAALFLLLATILFYPTASIATPAPSTHQEIRAQPSKPSPPTDAHALRLAFLVQQPQQPPYQQHSTHLDDPDSTPLLVSHHIQKISSPRIHTYWLINATFRAGSLSIDRETLDLNQDPTSRLEKRFSVKSVAFHHPSLPRPALDEQDSIAELLGGTDQHQPTPTLASLKDDGLEAAFALVHRKPNPAHEGEVYNLALKPGAFSSVPLAQVVKASSLNTPYANVNGIVVEVLPSGHSFSVTARAADSATPPSVGDALALDKQAEWVAKTSIRKLGMWFFRRPGKLGKLRIWSRLKVFGSGRSVAHELTHSGSDMDLHIQVARRVMVFVGSEDGSYRALRPADQVYQPSLPQSLGAAGRVQTLTDPFVEFRSPFARLSSKPNCAQAMKALKEWRSRLSKMDAFGRLRPAFESASLARHGVSWKGGGGHPHPHPRYHSWRKWLRKAIHRVASFYQSKDKNTRSFLLVVSIVQVVALSVFMASVLRRVSIKLASLASASYHYASHRSASQQAKRRMEMEKEEKMNHLLVDQGLISTEEGCIRLPSWTDKGPTPLTIIVEEPEHEWESDQYDSSGGGYEYGHGSRESSGYEHERPPYDQGYDERRKDE